MRRFASVMFCAVVFAACKKQEQAEPEPAPTTPSRGHSITKIKDPNEGSGSGSASGSESSSPGAGGAAGTAPSGAGSGSGSGSAARKLYGGDGSPARLDERGVPRGPGGPIFMGRGPECTDQIDHCLRDGVWFGIDNAVSGKMYRATPLFEYEGKWYDWRQKEQEFAIKLKTKPATDKNVKRLLPGDLVVWLVDANSSKKWLDNEYDALTSSRWTSGTVDSFAGADQIRVKGWSYGLVPVDTVRVVVERK